MVAKPQTDTSVSEMLRACLSLMRPANLITAAADVLAGWIVVGGSMDALGWRVAASVSLYAGGVVLNDFFDRNLDAVERPERPIPSGKVPAAAAAALGGLLLCAGVAAGLHASPITGMLAASIAALVLLYDISAKHHAAGPVVMGSCRALNLLLGLASVPAMLGHVWFLALLPLAYIAGITTLSRGEVNGGSRAASVVALTLFASVVLALAALQSTSGVRWLRLLPFLALLIAKVGPPLLRAYRHPEPTPIRAAVHAGVVSLIVLDAAIASGYGGVVSAAAILSLSVVAMELGRLFPVT
jgi:4-hydroxybenzoate polyprenyltransferase